MRRLQVSEAQRERFEARVRAGIEDLAPEWLAPPPAQPELPFLVRVALRWRGSYLYVDTHYTDPRPAAPEAAFSEPLLRFECCSADTCVLAFRRHTGAWEAIGAMTVEEALGFIRDVPSLHPA